MEPVSAVDESRDDLIIVERQIFSVDSKKNLGDGRVCKVKVVQFLNLSWVWFIHLDFDSLILT